MAKEIEGTPSDASRAAAPDAAARQVLTVLACVDLPRAVRFYARAFGWPQTVDVPVHAEFELPGGMRLGLHERGAFARNVGSEPVRIPGGGLAPTELYFHAQDLGAAIARLEAAGARLTSPRAPRDWGDEAAYFADPEGNVLVLARPLR